MDTIQLPETKKQNSFASILAKFFSYVFHPLFIPTYFFIWTYLRFPAEFAALAQREVTLRLVGVFITTAFFPALTVFLLWRLKFISNIYLHTTRERIIPYVASMIFYWWMWYLAREFTDQALSLKFFYFGIFIATIPALILNSFTKISMHAMGVSGFITAMIISCFMFQLYYGLDISIALLIGGFVLSSRIYLKQHTMPEIFLGVIVGVLSQLIAYWIMI